MISFISDTHSDDDQDRKELPPEMLLAEALEAEIIFGHLHPGQRLVEDEILRRFNASRHHVRAAFLILEQSGTVVRLRNKGAHVRSFTAQEVRHLYDVREMLTRQATLRIALPVASRSIEQLRLLQNDHDAAVAGNDFAALHAANDRFHNAIFKLCGNPYLLDMLRKSMDMTYVIRAGSISDAARMETARREHHIMIELLSSTDSWALAQISVEHLHPSRDAYLKRIEQDRVSPRSRRHSE